MPTRFACLLCLLLATLPATADEHRIEPVELPPVTPDVEHRWGVGLAYGNQWYGEDGAAGESGALQITYRAYLETEREGRWLFELGFERSLSYNNPEIDAEGTTRRIQSSGLFYRFNRFFGTRFYVGGRAGLSRVRGTEDKQNLDLVVGLQTGVRVTSWLDVGAELVTAAPSVSERAAFPADARGVVTISF